MKGYAKGKLLLWLLASVGAGGAGRPGDRRAGQSRQLACGLVCGLGPGISLQDAWLPEPITHLSALNRCQLLVAAGLPLHLVASLPRPAHILVLDGFAAGNGSSMHGGTLMRPQESMQ